MAEKTGCFPAAGNCPGPSAISHEPSAISAYLLGNPHHLHHLLYGVHTDNVGAGKDGGSDGGRGAPVARDSGPVVQSLPHERFARRTDEHRPVESAGDFTEPRQHTIAVRRTFGKPDP